MGCKQSTEVIEKKLPSSKPTIVGQSERGMICNSTPPPKLNTNGNLMQEEVVKRTDSSFVVSDVQLGNETKGSIIRARYAFQTQRGYYPDGKFNRTDPRWESIETAI